MAIRILQNFQDCFSLLSPAYKPFRLQSLPPHSVNDNFYYYFTTNWSFVKKKRLPKAPLRVIIDNVIGFVPKWWNWHTRTTQNRVGLAREGSTPSFGTIKEKPQHKLGIFVFPV